MANEFKHADHSGTETYGQYVGVNEHIAASQTTGDILYFDGTSWKRRPFDMGARAKNSADQTLATAEWTTLAWNSEDWDTDTIHDTVTNNSRLTCKTAGKYLVSYYIQFDSNATGYRSLIVQKNGGNTFGDANAAINGKETYLLGSYVESLAANDYLTLLAYQNSGGNLNVDLASFFAMQRIG